MPLRPKCQMEVTLCLSLKSRLKLEKAASLKPKISFRVHVFDVVPNSLSTYAGCYDGMVHSFVPNSFFIV